MDPLLSRAACLIAVAAPVAFLGCPFQTGGVPSANGSSSRTASSTTSSHGTGGGPATGGHTTTTTTTTHGAGGTGGMPGTGGMGGTGTGGVDAGPPTFTSCKDRLAASSKEGSGVKDLVDASQQPYKAFCEMGADGGGWTLVLKIDGNQSNFFFDNPLWTNNAPFNPDKPALDMTEAKLASFWSVPFTEVRVGMNDGKLRWLVVSLTSTSLLDAIKNGGSTSAGRDAWEGLLASGSLQTNCNWEGLNRQDHVRLGIVGDESIGCGTFPSPDSFIGFGAASNWGSPCGNTAHYSPDNGDRDTKVFGYVMVR